MNVIRVIMILTLLSSLAQTGFNIGDGEWVSYETESVGVTKYDNYSTGGIGAATVYYERVSEVEAIAYIAFTSWDGSTSSGYISIGLDEPNYYLLPQGIGLGNKFDTWTISSMATEFIAGEERDLLVCEETRVTSEGFEEIRICWDKETGVMVELLLESDNLDEYTLWYMRTNATSLWPKTGLLLSVEAEKEVVRIGEDIILNAQLTDDSGNPLPGASLICNINGYMIFLIDNGDGHYTCSIDSSSFSSGEYTAVVEAEKIGYTPTQVDVSVGVEKGFPIDLSDPNVRNMGGVIILLSASILLRKASSRRKMKQPLPEQEPTPSQPEAKNNRLKKTTTISKPSMETGKVCVSIKETPSHRDRETPTTGTSRPSHETEETHAPATEALSLSEIMESYKNLRERYSQNELDENEFRRLVGDHTYFDESGNRWRIGAESDSWYTLIGGSWATAEPPAKLYRRRS